MPHSRSNSDLLGANRTELLHNPSIAGSQATPKPLAPIDVKVEEADEEDVAKVAAAFFGGGG